MEWISLYFRHETRCPNNVLLAWHRMPAVPRVGDEMCGPFGDWVVTRVVWQGTLDEDSRFARVDVHVRDVRDREAGQ